MMLKDLRFVPGFSFQKDVPLFDFLNRVGSLELERDNDEEEEEEEAHPWLNLFLPKSQIMDFHAAVILNLIHTQNQTSGPILFYPLNRQKYSLTLSQLMKVLNFECVCDNGIVCADGMIGRRRWCQRMRTYSTH